MATSTVPCQGLTRERNSYVTPAFLGDPNKGDKIRSGYLTPCLLMGPQEGGNCYVTLAFWGIRNKGDKIRSGYLTLAFFEADKRAKLLHNPCILRVPKQGGQNEKWLPHPCLLGSPQEGGIAR